MKTLWTGIFR